MNLGPAEIAVILVLALIVFGPKRLPEVGRQIGGALRELRRVQDTMRVELNEALRDEPKDKRAKQRAAAPAAEPAAEERDHDDLPALPAADEPGPEPVERGFEGPPGSFS